MDSLLNAYGIVACTMVALSALVLIVAMLLPKERRKEIVRMAGRWWA